MSSPTKYPLLRMFEWESVAPLGNPVVPDVYWMLIGSWFVSPARISARTSASVGPETIDSHSSSPKSTTSSRSGQFGCTCASIPV